MLISVNVGSDYGILLGKMGIKFRLQKTRYQQFKQKKLHGVKNFEGIIKKIDTNSITEENDFDFSWEK